jgi:hypothetical protein
MTDKQKQEYEKRYIIDSYTCQQCGKPACHIAHRLSKSKENYKKFGKDIIDSNINLVSVCSLTCNDSCNIGCSTERQKRLVHLIAERGNESLSSEYITSVIDGDVKT